MAMAKGTQILHASGAARSDESGKGIVGKHSETDALRNKPSPSGDETLNYGGGHFETEKAGLEDGVSLRETVNPDEVEPEYDYTVDAFTGNAPERKVGRVNNKSVSGKGKKFSIGEF